MNLDQFQLDFPAHQSSQLVSSQPTSQPASSLPASPTRDYQLSSQQHAIQPSSQLGLPTSQLSSSQLVAEGRPKRATLAQKLEALDWHHSHSASQQQTVNHFMHKGEFGITRSSFNRWTKDEQRLRKSYMGLSAESRSIQKTLQQKKFAEVDKCLEKWYEQQLFHNQPVSERDLIQKWFTFHRLYHPESHTNREEEKSNGWIHHFKKCTASRKNDILQFVNSMTYQSKESEVSSIRHQLKEHSLKDIFHMDEFMVSNRVIPFANQSSKLVVGLCCNADGSEVIDPLIVTNFAIQGCYTSKVGLTTEIFWEYIKKFDSSLKGRKVVLLLDRLHQHVVAQNLENISVIWVSYSEPYHDAIRWLKLELKVMLLKYMHVEWINSRRIRVFQESDLLNMIQQAVDDLKEHKTLIRDCWLSSKFLPLLGQPAFNFKDEEVKFAKLLRIAHEEGIIEHAVGFGLDQILFPNDEKVCNRYHSDLDIVAIIKVATQNDEKEEVTYSAEANGTHRGVDRIKWQNVDKTLHVDLRNFFETEVEKFPRSRAAFMNLINEYVKESMDLWLEDRENNSILPDLG
jgi:hypothetical protein